MISAKVDTGEAIADISGFWRDMGKSLPAVLRKVARAECVALARSTQPTSEAADNQSTTHDPFYTGEADRRMGENKIERDIRKVYGNGGDVYRDIRAFSKNADNRQLADAFYYFYQSGQIKGQRGAQALLDASGSQFAGQDIGQKIDPSFHKAARNSRGSVPGRRSRSKLSQIPKSDSEIVKYVLKVQAKVGLAKAGWAAAAKSLGLSTRGIPKWVTRHKGNGSGVDNTGHATAPSVTVHNHVTYVSDLLAPSDFANALKIARERLQKEIEMAKAAIAAKRTK